MSVKNHSDLNSEITSDIDNNGAQLITGLILQQKLIDLADSAVNKLGDTDIQARLGYATLVSIANDGHIPHKYYVDSTIAAAVSAIDLSAYFKKDGSIAMTGNLNAGGHNLTNVAAITGYLGQLTLGDASSNAEIDGLNVNIISVGDTLISSGNALKFSNNNNFASFKTDLLSGDQTYNLPNASGTLALLSDIENYFVGKYTSLAALQAAVPTGADGEYAIVDSGSGSDAKQYIWDSSDSAWVLGSGSGVPDATSTTKGKLKLYSDLLASNTDGSVTQAALVAALLLKADDSVVLKKVNNLAEVADKTVANKNLGTPFNEVVPEAGSFTITASGNGKLYNVTGAALATLDGTTLFNGFKCFVRKADSTGLLTTSVSTSAIGKSGHMFEIICDGSAYIVKVVAGSFDASGNFTLSSIGDINLNPGSGILYINGAPVSTANSSKSLLGGI